MIIKQIWLHNFGLYYGDQKIDFLPEESGRNVTLIGGLNGRGKTTLLDSISLGLYGRRALRFLQDERISYNQYLINHINKNALTSETFIEIELLEAIDGVDSLVVHRSWKKDKRGQTHEKFTVLRDGNEDAQLAEHWDYYVEEILPLNISRFFFFDNEKISQLADDEAFENVKISIRNLLGLTTIDSLVDDAQQYISAAYTGKKDNSENQTELQLRELEQEYIQCRAEAERLIQERSDLEASLMLLQNQSSELEREFWAKGGNLGLKKEEMQQKKEEAVRQLNQKAEQTQTLVENPMLPMLICRSLLISTYNTAVTAEKEKDAHRLSQTIDWLNEHLNKVDYSENDRSLIVHFLSQMKEKVKGSEQALVSENTMSPSTYLQLTHLVQEMESQIKAIDTTKEDTIQLQNELASLETLLSFEACESDVREIWNKMQKVSKDMLDIQVKIRLNTENQERNKNHSDMLLRRRDTLRQKQLASGQILDQQQRMAEYARKTIKVMEIFKQKIQYNRTKELESTILSCFKFMMQKKGLIQGISIHPETLDIHLIDYNGQELLKDQLSAGEKQLFSVSIIWGLAMSSGYNMPVIIDTPLGRLDSNHRSNFVEQYLPRAGQQVIVLSTDEEINGRYFDMLKPHIRSLYTLVYDEATRSTSIVSGYFGGEMA